MGTHPIFESDFDCLTEKMDSDDEAPLLTRQEQINAQDRGLDDLAAIIRRQREIGVMIGNEVEEQNEIIDDVTHLADNARGRLDQQTEQVARLGDEKGTCYLWGIVIALFLVILTLVSLP